MSETEIVAIRDLLERRRVVWNSRDPDAYRALLTDDIEMVSATGRTSRGIDEALRLYVEQKQQPSYARALITATIVRNVRLLSATTAKADATYKMTGVCIPAATPPRAIEGDIVFTLRKDSEDWKIAALHATAPQTDGRRNI